MSAGRPATRRSLHIWFNDRLVGRWSITRAGHAFHYDDAWLAWPQARPVAWSLPLAGSGRGHSGARVESAFDQLLPGSGAARLRLQQRAGTSDASTFELLSAWGCDCLGAARFLRPDESVGDVHRVHAAALAEAELAALLDDAASPVDAPVRSRDPVRAVLPGRQPQLALLWHGGHWCRPEGATPTTHVLKLPLGTRPGGTPAVSTSLENEWLCGRVLAAFGFDVVPARLDTMAGRKVLVLDRVDRRWMADGWWARLPMQTFAQAVPPKGAARSSSPDLFAMLEMLRGAEQPARDRERLFMAQVVGWMLGATDRGAAQFGMSLLPGGLAALQPLHGVLSAWPILGRAPRTESVSRLKLALPPLPGASAVGHDAVTRQTWLDAARRAGLGSDISPLLDGLAGWTGQVIDRVASAMPSGFPSSVSEPVFAGLRRGATALAR